METFENLISAQISGQSQLIGSASNHIKVGLIGLPNVGKSMLFTVISGRNVSCSNFPFSTVDPNVAICCVADERFEWLCAVYHPLGEKTVPQRYTLIDTIAIVKGSSQGAGLGDVGLSAVRIADVLCHVVRAFDSSDLTHVAGPLDPLRDLDIIMTELIEKDKEIVSNRLALLDRNMCQNVGGSSLKFEFDTLVKVRDLLYGGSYAAELELRSGRSRVRNKTKAAQALAARAAEPADHVPIPLRHARWSLEECEVLSSHQFYTAKELVVALNVSKREALQYNRSMLTTQSDNTTNAVAELVAQIQARGYSTVVPLCVEFESEIVRLKRSGEWTSYLTANPTHFSSTDALVSSWYRVLRLITFYTASKDEVVSWRVRMESTVIQAAACVHADVERGFICAEVVTAEDVNEFREESALRRNGRVRQEGKRYLVNDGDVIYFQHRSSTL